jgi:DNA modification methylase
MGATLRGRRHCTCNGSSTIETGTQKVTLYLKKHNLELHHGHALDILKTLPAESVQTCITSPPYFALRSYLDASNPLKAFELGSESVHDCNGAFTGNRCGVCYICRLTAVFSEVKRVLRKDGLLWVNIGDSYNGSGKKEKQVNSPKQMTNRGAQQQAGTSISRLADKNLLGIPWRFALSLQADGWILRQDIIWSKGNSMPESVEDRCTKSHEYLFLFAKSANYYFDVEAIKEKATSTDNSLRDRDNTKLNNTPGRERMNGLTTNHYTARNKRSVWNINCEANSEFHYASFPRKLVRVPILASTSEKGCCPSCGKGWKRISDHATFYEGSMVGSDPQRKYGNREYGRGPKNNLGASIASTLGWEVGCKCGVGEEDLVPSVVLDCFAGTGTVGVVALDYGRHFWGIDLNCDYLEMSERRTAPMAAQPRLEF